ncbi:MAG: alginate export family protein [Limisphaerales bacterium]
MTTKTQTLTIITLGATLVIASAQTNQTTATAPAAAPLALNSTEQMIQDIKNPFSWLNWGADLRIRNEYFNNALSLTPNSQLPAPGSSAFGEVHSQDYFRIRGRVWTTLTPTEDLSLNARLAAEPRDFMEPGFSDTYYQQSGMQWRYGIVDNLNVQWKKPLDLPATLTVGRQDIFLGDGWLVGDGTPEDGSFTYFLDAARFTYNLEDQKTTIDAIGIVQYGRPDAWLPTIGPSSSVQTTLASPPPYGHVEPFLLTDQNEKGAILWIANKSLPAANVDAYFIYKHDSALNDYPVSLFTDNADIYTFGGRLSGSLDQHWKYSAEGAYQFGRKQDQELNSALAFLRPNDPSVQTTGFRDLSAFGVNSKLSYLFKDSWNDQLSLSFEFLSGDNPNTKGDEMFDVLWGRWPSWSEMYNIYSYVQETRVGQTANLYRVGPTWNVTPVKDLDFSASYYALFADQAVPTRDFDASSQLPPALQTTGPFSTTGTFRGHYLQGVLKYKFSRHMTGHLWSEFLFPGDYYVSKEMMTFLRAEVMFTF